MCWIFFFFSDFITASVPFEPWEKPSLNWKFFSCQSYLVYPVYIYTYIYFIPFFLYDRHAVIISYIFYFSYMLNINCHVAISYIVNNEYEYMKAYA